MTQIHRLYHCVSLYTYPLFISHLDVYGHGQWGHEQFGTLWFRQFALPNYLFFNFWLFTHCVYFFTFSLCTEDDVVQQMIASITQQVESQRVIDDNRKYAICEATSAHYGSLWFDTKYVDMIWGKESVSNVEPLDPISKWQNIIIQWHHDIWWQWLWVILSDSVTQFDTFYDVFFMMIYMISFCFSFFWCWNCWIIFFPFFFDENDGTLLVIYTILEQEVFDTVCALSFWYFLFCLRWFGCCILNPFGFITVVFRLIFVMMQYVTFSIFCNISVSN